MITRIAAFAASAVLAQVAYTADAHADTSYVFESPSGNIACMMFANDGIPMVECDLAEHTFTTPPRPADCPLTWGDRFELEQNGSAGLSCHGDTVRVPGEETLGYGQTRSLGAITCDSEQSGMTCTDNGTGHFFRIARDSYQLG